MAACDGEICVCKSGMYVDVNQWFQNTWTRRIQQLRNLTLPLLFLTACLVHQLSLYAISFTTMRASRFASLSFRRSNNRLVSTEHGLSRPRIAGNVEFPTTASICIRRLASVAAQPIHTHVSDPSSPKLSSRVIISPESLRRQVEAVDALLRSGIGGSDVWTERLQGVKDDFDNKRPRRIAGESFRIHVRLTSSRRRCDMWSEGRRLVAIAGPNFGHDCKSTRSVDTAH